MPVFRDRPGLLADFREGQAEALGEVFTATVDAVDAVIRNGCRAGAKASVPGVRGQEMERDLVHEVYRRAFSPKARGAFDGLRPYRPYLLTIARNTLIDYWRKRGRELNRFPADSALEVDPPVEAADTFDEEDLDQMARIEATQEFLAALPEDRREFVRLRFEQELSQADLVKQLGVTRWRIRSLERSVRVGLRKHLKKKGLIEK